MKHYLLTFLATLLAITAMGQTQTPPYSSTMTDWTIVDVNGDGGNNTWVTSTSSSDWSGSGFSSGLKYTWNSQKAADDWAISPAIHLEGGKKYTVTHVGKRASNNYNEIYKLYYGQSGDYETLGAGEAIFDSDNKLSNSFQTFKQLISVTTTGDYYFGFHVTSPANYYNVFITGFNIEEYLELPGTVSNVTITPGEQGAKTATLAWEWPTLNNLGSTLETDLAGAKIYRGTTSYFTPSESNLVYTLNLPSPASPGSSQTWVDNTFTEDNPNGNYYYKIVAFVEGGDGSVPTTSTQIWVGPDTGYADPKNFSVTADPDDPTVAIINFDKVTTGKNNGWVDTSVLGYTIKRYEGGYASGTATVVAENYKGELPFRDTTIPKLGKYTYGLNLVVDGEPANTVYTLGSITAGPTPTVPYTEGFNTSSSLEVFTKARNGSGNDWSSTTEGGEPCVMHYQNITSTIDAWLISPSIQIEGGKTYALKVDAWGKNKDNAEVNKFGELYLYVGQGTAIANFTEELGHYVITSKTPETLEAHIYIEEPGLYNLAVRNFATDYSKYYNYLFIDNLTLVELPLAPLAPTDVTTEVGADGQRSVTLNWTNPSLNNRNETLTEITKMEIYRSGDNDENPVLVTTLNDQTVGEPGTYTDSSITEDGFYTYTLKPYLQENTYDYAEVTTAWVGEDDLAPVKDVVAVMSTDDFNNIEISFTSEGANGGWFDHDNISYKITRRVNGSQTETTVKEGLKYSELPYVDTTAPGLNAYVYKVYLTELELDNGVNSNKIVGGGTADLPYLNTFDAMPSLDLFYMGHSSTSSRDWSWASNALAYTRFGSSYSADQDTWAISVPFEFKGEGNYKISFKPYVTNSVYDKPLKVYIVNSLNSEDWGEPIFNQKINLSSTYASVESVEYQAPSTGVYYVVFRYTGNATDYNYLYVDDFAVERNDRAPIAVEDLTVAADPAGLMKATISWTNPTLDNKGDELQKIDKVVVYRDNREIGTLDEVTVGGESSFEDEIDGDPGYYNYTAVAYLDDVPGIKGAATQAWIGPDELKAPENVSVALNLDGRPNVTFSAVVDGKHGGYIDAAAVRYKIYRDSNVVASDVAETTYVDDDEELATGNYVYGVQAYIGEDQTSEITRAASFKFKAVVDLPVDYNLSTEAVSQQWELSGFRYDSTVPGIRSAGANDNEWAYTEPFRATEGEIKLTVTLSAESSAKPRDIDIFLLTDINNKDNKIAPNEAQIRDVANTKANPQEHELTFDVPESGVYYLGFNSLSTSYYYIYVHSANIEQTSTVDPETPNAPTNVEVALQENGSRTVTFDAVTTNKGGEALEDVTYTIYLDNEVIEEGWTETTYVDDSDADLGVHVYGVQAVSNGYESKIVKSEPMLFGAALPLPYEPDYSDVSSFDYWTFVNENPASTAQWKYNTTTHCLETGFTSNLWAITPPLRIQKGTGEIDLSYRTYNGTKTETLQIYLVSDLNDLESAQLLDSRDISTGLQTNLKIDVDFPASGTYYIGFKEASADPWAIYLYKSDIRQTSVEIAIPAPQNVTAAIEDDDTRTITFDAVTADEAGNDLGEGVTYTIYRNGDVIAEEVETTIYNDTETGLQYASYVYGVQAVYNDAASEIAYADAILFGEPIHVDMVTSYDSDLTDDIDLWTFKPGEDNGYWTVVEGDEGNHLLSTTEGAMVISPAFQLNMGVIRVTVDASGGIENGDEHITMYLLTEPGESRNGLSAPRRIVENGTLISDLQLNGTDVQTFDPWRVVIRDGVYYIGFVSSPDAAGEGVKLHSFSIKGEDIQTGIGQAYTDGELIYNKAIETIMIPSAGRLEVFTTNGMRVVSVDTTDHVSIAELVSATYVARFVDAQGTVLTLKFVK